MDYDDNDFQGQNLSLAGEGSSKFSPVLRPYALPKFEFDDSLHGHLRFDSLVENEVFLGIPSQEDNQWIEDFSRGSSGIEFSSSAAESCSISRHNNVWSEATSSESVEMLLKSVGQEEMVPGETIVEESDACDELGSLTKQMEPNLKQDDGVKDAIDSHPELPPDECLEHFSGLNEGAGGGCPHVEGTSQTQEAEPFNHGSPSELDPNAVSEKSDLFVIQKNLGIDKKCDYANQSEVDISVNESLDNEMQKDPSVSEMQIDNVDSSSHDIIASVGELNNQEIPHRVSDFSLKNADGSPKDIGKEVEEHHVVSNEANMNDQDLKGSAVETGTNNLGSPPCLASKVESVEGHAVETSINNFEEPSSLPVKGDADLQIAEGCSEDVYSTNPALGSKCGVVDLSKSTEINQQFKGNMHEESPVVFQGDSNFDGHADEVSNTEAGICASAQLKIGSSMQVTNGQSINIAKKENFRGNDCQLDCEASVSNSEASLLTGVDNKLPNGEGDGSKNNYVENLSNLMVVHSATELLGEKHAIENLKGVNHASGIHKEDSDAVYHISPPRLAGSVQICEGDISNQGDFHCDQDVSFNERGNAKLPTDSSLMDCDTVGSLSMDKKVGCSSLGEGIKENDTVVVGLEYDTTARNEPALVGTLETTNLRSNNTSDGVPSLSGSGATADEVTDHSEEQKSPLLVEGFMHLDKKEETKVEVLTEASLSTLKECSDGASAPGPVSEVEKGVSSDSAIQLLQDSVDQPLPMVETCNTESRNEQAAVANEVSQEGSKKLEVCLVLCDSTVKEDNNAEAVVVLENHVEATIEKNHEVASSQAADAVLVPNKDKRVTESIPVSLMESCTDVGQQDREYNEAVMASGVDASGQIAPSIEVDTSNDGQGTSGLARLSESDANLVLEGGRSSADADKVNCDSPTIISCTELSQSVKDRQEGVKGSPDTSVPLSGVTDGAADKVQSASQDPRGKDATKDEGSFTFEVNQLACQSERETSKAWQSFPTIQACKTSMMEGSPTSGLGQMDPKRMPEISCGTPRTPDGENLHGGSKGTPERKTRRASGKATGKENTKKGTHVKEAAPTRQSERGGKSSSLSMSPSGISQLVKFEGLKPYGNVECSGTKPSGVISIPTSNLPDLNTSTPPSALFQQPFTDLQQVQLRAQIFVYGSLIQGTVPDDTCMISAFGPSDGGKSIWEPAWRACVERVQGQKSHPNISETPVQSRSELRNAGARAADQAIKQGPLQSKVLPSPVGRASSKSTPSPVVNSMLPLSSPLWSISTPSCDGLQSSGMGRGTLLDYHQTLSPLHPYQTPSVRNFVGHNASWLSQAPFPGAWVASPQTSAIDASARFPVLPITEAVKLTPVKESSVPISSGTKHASPSPVVHSGSPSVFAGKSSLLDMKKVTVSPVQHSTDPKSRKRKKVPVSEDLGQISLIAQTRTESVSAPVISHLSTAVAVTTSACFASKSNTGKIVTAVTPTSSTDHPKRGDQKVIITEETFSKVVEARLQAEDAAAHAAAAVSHSQGVWSQLEKQKNSGLISDVEAKLASAAVAMAAAAAVAKAAAEAAKIASNAALQAKLMADEALVSTGTGDPTQSSSISPSNVVNNLGKATSASFLKGGDESNGSRSIIFAAREAARRRLEGASAALKHAENLDAIVKAAELAAEAVSQAGKIVAMCDPLPLSELVESGPEGYWKVPQVPSEQGVKSNNMNREQSNVDRVEEGPNVFAKQSKEGPSDKNEKQTTNHGMQPLSKEIPRESKEDLMRVVDGISAFVSSSGKDLREERGRRAFDLAKTIGVVPESEIGLRSTSVIVQDEYDKAVGTSKENSIKEGCLIEVFRDGEDIKAAWFSATVLSLKDGKAFICYTEL
uniref:Agenet-like domain-containing protein n=1 Tax=Davidia involucrata TaxID=16924 RepID=A0A5B6ZKG5_DAVIN